MLKELIKNYEKENNIAKEISYELDEKIGKHAELIEKYKKFIKMHENEISKLDNKKDKIDYPSWIDCIVIPLAKELALKLNLEYDIYGPFGLRAETSIYFKENKNLSITEQEVIGITLIPGLKKGMIMYDTGKKKGAYHKDSIGYANGFDNEVAQLPDSIDDILKLIK